ncbi:MFS transporter [Lentzea sp. NPDC092896]|uniref:MFS transporter n=1 Tax=Lentzea sp. NPDC092896 TaxID=3364127 RepID=UPI00381B17FF
MGRGRAARPNLGPEFRALWYAEATSVVGNQLAKVAIALLVLDRTGSVAWSGAIYGLMLLAPLVAGPVLTPLADRLPRREVMIASCVVQAGLVTVMALPGVSVIVLAAAAAAVAGVQALYAAARGAVVLDVVGAEYHKSGRTRLMLVREWGQLLGLAATAAVIGVIGPTVALVLDAVSFLVAAVLLRCGLRSRTAARTIPAGAPTGKRASSSGTLWRVLREDRQARLMAILFVLIGFTAVPDGLAAPLVAQAHGPESMVAVLLAADCVGVIVMGHWLERQSSERQRRLVVPLALLCQAPLVAFAFQPPPLIAAGLLVVSGAGSAYYSAAGGEITERVPSGFTGGANGLLNTALSAGQGVAVLAGAAVAQWVKSASSAVALAGAVGLGIAGLSVLLLRREVCSSQVR